MDSEVQEIKFIEQKPVLSILKPFKGDHLQIHYTEKKPNWWFRMWQYLLLGWTWEDYSG